MGEPGKQNCEPFLGEVMIVAQHFRNAERPHGDHRAAIGEAVCLVESRFVERKSGIEIGPGLRQDGILRVVSYIANCRNRMGPAHSTRACQCVKEFRENLVGGDDTSRDIYSRPVPCHGSRGLAKATQ